MSEDWADAEHTRSLTPHHPPDMMIYQDEYEDQQSSTFHSTTRIRDSSVHSLSIMKIRVPSLLTVFLKYGQLDSQYFIFLLIIMRWESTLSILIIWNSLTQWHRLCTLKPSHFFSRNLLPTAFQSTAPQ